MSLSKQVLNAIVACSIRTGKYCLADVFVLPWAMVNLVRGYYLRFAIPEFCQVINSSVDPMSTGTCPTMRRE